MGQLSKSNLSNQLRGNHYASRFNDEGSMTTKVRAKRLQDGLNACLQTRFSVFNKELELEESLEHPRIIMDLEINIHSHCRHVPETTRSGRRP